MLKAGNEGNSWTVITSITSTYLHTCQVKGKFADLYRFFPGFLIASMQCVSDLKKEFVVGGGVVVVLDSELLSKFPQKSKMNRANTCKNYAILIVYS